jgi:hypothetical protein
MTRDKFWRLALWGMPLFYVAVLGPSDAPMNRLIAWVNAVQPIAIAVIELLVRK